MSAINRQIDGRYHYYQHYQRSLTAKARNRSVEQGWRIKTIEAGRRIDQYTFLQVVRAEHSTATLVSY
jgi:hypothetical protein